MKMAANYKNSYNKIVIDDTFHLSRMSEVFLIFCPIQIAEIFCHCPPVNQSLRNCNINVE
jgi:hypothetical protein